MPNENIGDISNLISKSAPKPPKAPSRIEVLETRVETLETALKTVVKELTALRAEVKGLSLSKAKASPKTDAKPPSAEPPKPPPKATPKPDAPPDAAATPPEKNSAKRKHKNLWDDPEILQELQACRQRLLEHLKTVGETTKQGCADALSINPRLAGRTLSYMVTVKKDIQMISPPKTEADPDPKKIFRLKKK